MNLSDVLDFKRIPYFVCIGTSRVTLDSVAPLVGDKLKLAGFKVIGTSDDNVHAVNVQKKYDEIISKIDKRIYQVIAIDAMICNTDEVFAYVDDQPCKPGVAVGKTLVSIGECTIGCNLTKTGMKRIEIIHMMTRQQPEFLENSMKIFVEKLSSVVFNTILVNTIGYRDVIFGASQILDGKTIRQACEHVAIPRATLHYSIHKHLPRLNPRLYDMVCMKLIENYADRNRRGGEATKQMFARRKAECQSCLNCC